jgi:hypothetical protein
MKLIFQSSTSIVNLLELTTAAQDCVHRPISIKSLVGYGPLLQPLPPGRWLLDPESKFLESGARFAEFKGKVQKT